MNQSLTIATGVPALDQKIAEKYPFSANVKTEDQLKAINTPILVWSYFLLTGVDHNEKKVRLKQWLAYLDENGVQSVFLCPYEDWIEELTHEGFSGFIPINNNNVPLKRLFATIEERMHEPAQDVSPTLTFSDENLNMPASQALSRPTKVWAFWSAKPGMGVSTLTQALAFELAQAGHKTLLIEWDTQYQSIAYSLGLSDPKRCIERWITDVEGGLNPRLEDYILNKTMYLQTSNDKDMRKMIESLPDNLFVLAPSNQIKPWDMVTMEISTVKRALDSLSELDFSVVLIDVPSQITHSATAVTIQRADRAFAVLDGKGSNAVITKMNVDFMENELDVSLELILNNIDDGAIKNIEKGVGKRAVMVLPFDETLSQRSMELNPRAGEEYQSVIAQFLEEQAYIEGAKGKRRWFQFQWKKETRENEPRKETQNQLASFLRFS